MRTKLLRRHPIYCIAATALSLSMALQAQDAKPLAPQPAPAAPSAAEPKSTVPVKPREAVQEKASTPSKPEIIPRSPVPERPAKEAQMEKVERKSSAEARVSAEPARPEENSKAFAKDHSPLVVLPSRDALLKGNAVKQLRQKWESKATVWHKTDTKTIESKLSTTKDVTMLSPLARHPLKPRPGTCRVVISGPQGGVRWDQEPLVTNGNMVLDIEAQIDVFMGDVPLKMALTYENSAGVHMGPAITVKGKPDEYTRVNLPSPLGGKSQPISGDKSDPLTGTQPVKFGVMIIPQGRQSTPVVVGIENFEVRVATAIPLTPSQNGGTSAPSPKSDVKAQK